MKQRRTGILLGRFMPPHAGHQLAVDFACAWVEHLSVLQYSRAEDDIAGSVRAAWLAQLFPGVELRHIEDELPWFDEAHEDLWTLWRDHLAEQFPDGVDCVFGSERYGLELAKLVGADFVPIDPERSMVPVHARDIRAEPLAHWEFIPAIVRPAYVKRVCLFGPEGTGKTMLAEQLAIHYDTVCAFEYREGLLALRKRPKPDMELVARGQVSAEDAMARQANRVLFCDTDALSVNVRGQLDGKKVPAPVQHLIDARSYDLYLLMDVTTAFGGVPGVAADPERAQAFERFRQTLIESERRYLRLDGDPDTRFRIACDAVDNLLGTPSGRPPRPD